MSDKEHRLTIRIPGTLNAALDRFVDDSNANSPGARYTKTGVILALVAKGMPQPKGKK